jgi:hemoglobin
MESTIYHAAGSMPGMVALAHAWHERCLDDPVVSHAFSHGLHPDHTARLASYWAEALGGPTSYSVEIADETAVVRMHSGNGEYQEMDERAIACFEGALSDVGLEGQVAAALLAYFTWAIAAMSGYPDSAHDVPEGLPLLRWSWDGPV